MPEQQKQEASQPPIQEHLMTVLADRKSHPGLDHDFDSIAARRMVQFALDQDTIDISSHNVYALPMNGEPAAAESASDVVQSRFPFLFCGAIADTKASMIYMYLQRCQIVPLAAEYTVNPVLSQSVFPSSSYARVALPINELGKYLPNFEKAALSRTISPEGRDLRYYYFMQDLCSLLAQKPALAGLAQQNESLQVEMLMMRSQNSQGIRESLIRLVSTGIDKVRLLTLLMLHDADLYYKITDVLIRNSNMVPINPWIAVDLGRIGYTGRDMATLMPPIPYRDDDHTPKV